MRDYIQLYTIVIRLVPCLLVGTMWIRSHFVTDMLGSSVPGRIVRMASSGGEISVEIYTNDAPCPGNETKPWSWYSFSGRQGLWHFGEPSDCPLGSQRMFGHLYSSSRLPKHVILSFGPFKDWGILTDRRWWAHYSLLVCATALWPASRLTHMLVKRRPVASFRCHICAYDLRATPSRCPECGAACKAASPVGESPAAGN